MRRTTWDFAFFDALKRLREKRKMTAYAYLLDNAQSAAMRQRRMWRSISAVPDALKLDFFSVAMGNFVPFRTQGNRVFAAECMRIPGLIELAAAEAPTPSFAAAPSTTEPPQTATAATDTAT
jgi:hypothetical protein